MQQIVSMEGMIHLASAHAGSQSCTPLSDGNELKVHNLNTFTELSVDGATRRCSKTVDQVCTEVSRDTNLSNGILVCTKSTRIPAALHLQHLKLSAV